MIAIGRMLSRAIVTVNEDEILSQLALFCASGLLVSIAMVIWGLDLGPGF